MIILGAGMSGCLAGLVNPQAQIYEAQDTPPINHNAVLRFRDDSVSKITGIPFKEVTVHKGIYHRGQFVKPDIRLANMYSQKVLGEVADRSIWNLDPVVRYVAPPDFQSQLYELVNDRVILGVPVDNVNVLEPYPVLSTIPMPALLKILEMDIPELDFRYQEIGTVKYKISSCNVHQTIYFPGYETAIYRATLTGNNLIVEMIPYKAALHENIDYVLKAFGLTDDIILGKPEITKQSYGKIADIDDKLRRKALYQITKEFNIYSAGRFAIWKNVLMDDVLQDLRVIKEMQAKDGYEHHRRY